jgi:hypothetical protein
MNDLKAHAEKLVAESATPSVKPAVEAKYYEERNFARSGK